MTSPRSLHHDPVLRSISPVAPAPAVRRTLLPNLPTLSLDFSYEVGVIRWDLPYLFPICTERDPGYLHEKGGSLGIDGEHAKTRFEKKKKKKQLFGMFKHNKLVLLTHPHEYNAIGRNIFGNNIQNQNARPELKGSTHSPTLPFDSSPFFATK